MSPRVAQPLTIQLLLDVHDDRRVLRAVEAFVATRCGAILVRPTPGCSGSRSLCRDVLYAAGLPERPPTRPWVLMPETRAAALLRRKRVRELWVLRAHAIYGWTWLADLAVGAGIRLYLVIHAPAPSPSEIASLRFRRFPMATPREIRLSTDRVALSLGITPEEGWGLDPSARVFWLPALTI